jgi:hypothetical protein
MYWNDTTVYLYSQQTALRDDQRLDHGCYKKSPGLIRLATAVARSAAADAA